MFQSLAGNNIDPATGRPYYFGVLGGSNGGLSNSPPQAVSNSGQPASSNPWYDTNRLQALIDAYPRASDGRRVLNHGELLSTLTQQTGIRTVIPNATERVQPGMWRDPLGAQDVSNLNDGWVVGGGTADSGGQYMWGGDDSKLVDQFVRGEYRGANNQLYNGVGTDADGNQLIQWSDNNGDGWQNPTGSGHDRIAPTYRLDANGNATPVSTGERYAPSGWVDYGRGLATLAAAMATVGFGGAALEGAGALGAGGAGAGGVSADSLAYGALENGAAYGSGAGDTLLASSAGGLPEGAIGATGATGGTNAALIESQLGTAGYGASSAGLGGGVGDLAGIAGPSVGGATGGSGWLGSLNNTLGTNFTGSQVLGAGTSLVNGLIGSYSAGRAADAQTNATNSANALQQNIYNQNRSDWAPYRATGYAGLQGMNNLLANPNSITSDPGFQFQLQQGQQGLDRRAAAGGGMYSGAQIKAGERYNQDYASSALDRALARYGSAAQIGATGTQGSQAAGTSYANNVGANTTALGNALGANALYQGNAWQNALNGTAATFNQSTYR